MMYLFHGEEYNYISDVLNDVCQDDFLFEKYLGEALKGFAPLQIYRGIVNHDLELADEIVESVDELIIRDIEEVEEDEID